MKQINKIGDSLNCGNKLTMISILCHDWNVCCQSEKCCAWVCFLSLVTISTENQIICWKIENKTTTKVTPQMNELTVQFGIPKRKVKYGFENCHQTRKIN